MSKERLEEIEKRVFSRTFHTGLEVDMITLPERDYIYLKKQAERTVTLEKREEVRKMGDEANSKYYGKIEQQNKRYRETIEYMKLKLRDFRKDANTIQKLSRDRVVPGEAFRLSCDIRDCLEALESESNETN